MRMRKVAKENRKTTKVYFDKEEYELNLNSKRQSNTDIFNSLNIRRCD